MTLKKLKPILALVLALSLTAGSLTACGSSSSSKEDPAENLADEDILLAEDEDPATPSPTPELPPVDPYQSAAQELIKTALDLCASGESISADAADLSRTLANSFEKEDNKEELDAYIKFCADNSASLAQCSADASSIIEQCETAPESAAGRKIRTELDKLLKEMAGNFDQLSDLLVFYQEQHDLYNEYMVTDYTPETTEEKISFIEDVYFSLYDLQQAYSEMKKPALVAGLWEKNAAQLNLAAESLNYSYTGLLANSTLDTYIFQELTDYADIQDTNYSTGVLRVMAEAMDQVNDLFSDTYPKILNEIQSACETWEAPSITRNASPVFDYNMISKVYPNGYPGLDSVINLTASTTAEKQDVIITAEISGFTQEYRQKVTLTTCPQHFMIKPPVLINLPDLSTKRTTQLKFTITDNDTGKVLVQDSRNITLYSIFDFFWYTDEFGVNSAFDILGWLRPESNAVTAINRQAISYLESIGVSDALVGYQYAISQDEELNTLIQVAAIQKAISDLGVRYTLDDYSFAAQQHVLTPDQVLAKKTGLCIESSLLMASCLMSAGFHTMILLVPGHAQVAVETWNGSNGRTGEYFLIETTDLPYDGFLTTDGYLDFGDAFPNASDPSSEWWKNYISEQDGYELFDGDVFVIDCDLRSMMNIQGLESVQAELKLDPVIYPGGNGTSIVDTTPEDEPIKEEDVKPAQEAAEENAKPEEPENEETPEPDNGTSDTSSEEEESEYITVTSYKEDFSFIAKSDVTGTLYENSVVIYPLGNDNLPLMLVSRVTDTSAEEYLQEWIDMLAEDETVTEKPAEISKDSSGDLTLYSIEYSSTEETGSILDNLVAVLPQEDGSLAVFYLMIDTEAEDSVYNALIESLYLAIYTFTVL